MDRVVAAATVVYIIPARGGSKSIPGKNIKRFGAHPLLAYSIAAGLRAKLAGPVLVSSDDPSIGKVAQDYGAGWIERPKHLAADDTLDLPVFQHALDWLEREQGYRPEIVVQLRPTSPLRPPGCVDEAVQILLDHPEADSVRAVVEPNENPFKMWTLDGGALLPLLRPEEVSLLAPLRGREPYNLRRQDLPTTYWQTGQIDVVRSSTILEKRSMTGEVILPWILDDARYAVDLNSLWEWAAAEALLDGLDCVRPGPAPRPLPARVELVVLDFDGVLTDDRVWVDQDGRESIAALRADGVGVAQLKEQGVTVMVLSAEPNPVVAARCRKLGIEAIQGISDKGTVLAQLLKERGVPSDRVVYLGNDVNDLPCFPLVGWAVAVADANPEVLLRADYRLAKSGGHGAVRELSDLLLRRGIG
ncbi:MAG: cytidylyltransferase domain-containing protein [Anaerolineales bacterium]